ncbi:hypothetical protein C8Q75DRAFT_779589 [Abortiporus biennis]|nr:hypothetical protein C8Q75DRAFT_779589 [Abortiporus biennis]
MASRPHPHISIPPGATQPIQPSPVTDSWNFLVTPPETRDPLHLWNDSNRHSSFASSSFTSSNVSDPSFPEPELSSRPSSRASSAFESANYAFPEPQIYRSTSQRSLLRPSPSTRSIGHRSTRSDLLLSASPQTARGESRPPSFIGSSDESSPELSATELSDELSNLTLESEEDLRRFQAGDLAEKDEEWYKLVPPEAREVLDKNEVLRQSIIFEVIKAERDYVRDLELVQDVFVLPMKNTAPLPSHKISGFIQQVFYNMDEILEYHRQMLAALFERQREQHPLVQSIADVVLDTTLKFRDAYEKYIKHYPIAEATHRNEYNRNTKYQYFLSQCAQDPRIRKREFNTFLTRPVTRLPRLKLTLEEIKKHTAPDHPDQDTLPLILNVLGDFLKSTQPGIEAAESKVKFWALCESLVFQRGEIIDLDLYDDSRTLIYSNTLSRRYRGEVGYSWADLNVALLDTYLLLLKPEHRTNGTSKNGVVSRPIPLEYLRLASFDAPAETRKEKSKSSISDQTRLFDSFRSKVVNVYPFTVYHASAKMIRRYTLYASSEEERQKWRSVLVDALGVRNTWRQVNKLFAPHILSQGFFKGVSSVPYNSGVKFTGKILCATGFMSGGRSFMAVGTPNGVYVAPRGQSTFRWILRVPSPTYLCPLPAFNKFLILSDSGLQSYSLDLLARVSLQTSPPQHLDNSLEKLSPPDSVVVFAKVGIIGKRTMVLFGTKGFLYMTLHVMEAIPPAEAARRSVASGPLSFRNSGEPVTIPKDSHSVTSLHRNIGVSTERGVHIIDPQNLALSTTNQMVVPNFTTADGNPPMQTLKQRCASAKPLGLIKMESGEELIVIYDELACYINKHGLPIRQSGYLRWETKAISFAHRHPYIILFSSDFIELRDINTGKLLQVIEGTDIRLVHESNKDILVAAKELITDGTTANGVMTPTSSTSGSRMENGDKLYELIETMPLVYRRQPQKSSAEESQKLWDEWDM